uniref:Uncharacterized protein n=1 Tax=uncultured alpha proteobacterium HF0010_30A23 TaxID=710802 RepID=E0XRM4_9PROT|nr:hypothetical protein [uncultured alpha proteobacterium HF0010_30A23]
MTAISPDFDTEAQFHSDYRPRNCPRRLVSVGCLGELFFFGLVAGAGFEPATFRL